MRKSRRLSWKTELVALLFCGVLSCDGETKSTADADGDGHLSPVDCDDQAPDIHPGAQEICGDGVDQDCSGRDLSCAAQDQDGDGFAVGEGDCDDGDRHTNPGATETCGDGVDQDCDGADLICDDADQDRDGFTINQGDCDDADYLSAPGRLEICDDGKDQDCDGRDLPCDELDEDGDGYSVADGDCDDTKRRVFPGAYESCQNGVDEDCDGIDPPCLLEDLDQDEVEDSVDVCPNVPDPFQADRDADGVGDACDLCPAARDPEQQDSDGDGQGDACDSDVDHDGDGVLGRDGDCDDSAPAVNPNAAETCNGVDDDCNGFVDDDCPGVDLRSPLATLPAGPSLLGSQDADEASCARDATSDENCDEVPQRQVSLSAFRIETHEVTNDQYRACVTAGRCTPPFRLADQASPFDDPERGGRPVVWVSQVQAGAYCAFIGGHLPTEAQWERAARGDAPTADRRFPWGDTLPDCDTAVLQSCEAEPVDADTENGDITAQGVQHLGGNVHELVDGFYDPTFYSTAAEQDPGPVMHQVSAREQIPVRGGSHRAAAAFSTLSYRGFRLLMSRREGRPDVGFRCVR